MLDTPINPPAPAPLAKLTAPPAEPPPNNPDNPPPASLPPA